MLILQLHLQDNKKEPQKGSGVLQVRILLNEISDGNGIANVNQNRIKALGHFESFIHGVVHEASLALALARATAAGSIS